MSGKKKAKAKKKGGKKKSGSGKVGIAVHVRVRPPDKKKTVIPWTWGAKTIQESGTDEAHVYKSIFTPDDDNAKLYDVCARPAVNKAIKGFNATIFAYGQTGSGKTHTIHGYKKDKGLVPRSFEQIFRTVKQQKTRLFLLRVSYFEIYNEVVYDLLAPKATKKRVKLDMRFNNDAFELPNLKEVVITSLAQITDLLKKGAKNRTVGVNNVHEQSSRSHSVLRLVMESTERGRSKGQSADDDDDDDDDDEKSDDEESTIGNDDDDDIVLDNAVPTGGKLDGAVRVSHVNFVDLAGSESLSYDFDKGQQAETKHINKSLSSLKDVITALSKAAKFIPYRNSVLTSLLQGSLGGNSRTVLVCTMHPGKKYYKTSKMTLEFGSLAKKIKSKPKANYEFGGKGKAQLLEYRMRIDKLENQRSQVLQDKMRLQADYFKLKEEFEALRRQEEEQKALRDEVKGISNMVVNAGDDEQSEPSYVAEVTEQEMQQLTEQLSDLQLKNDALQAKLQEHQREKRKAERLVEAKMKEVAKERAKTREHQEELELLVAQKQAERRKTSQLVARMEAERKKALEREKQVKELEKQRLEIEKQKLEQENHLSELQKENERLDSLRAVAEAQMQEQTAALGHLRTTVEQKQEELNKMEEEKNLLHLSVMQKESALQQFKQDVISKDVVKDFNLADIISKYEKQIMDLTKARNEADEALNVKEIDRLRAIQQNRKLKKQLQELQIRLASVSSAQHSFSNESMASQSGNESDFELAMRLQAEEEKRRERSRNKPRQPAPALEEKHAQPQVTPQPGAPGSAEPGAPSSNPGSSASSSKAKDEASDKELEVFTENAKRGAPFLKHGRKGKPHERHITVDNGALYWKKNYVYLSAVKEVKTGCVSDVFQRSMSQGFHPVPDRCFSLVLDERTLDLEAKDDSTAREWLRGLRGLVKRARAK